MLGNGKIHFGAAILTQLFIILGNLPRAAFFVRALECFLAGPLGRLVRHLVVKRR